MQLQKQCPYMDSLIADFQKSTISGEIWSHSPPNYPFTICMHLVVMSTHLWSHQQILLGNKLIQCSYATALTTIKPCLGCGRNFIGHSCISFDHLTTVDNFLHCSIAMPVAIRTTRDGITFQSTLKLQGPFVSMLHSLCSTTFFMSVMLSYI